MKSQKVNCTNIWFACVLVLFLISCRYYSHRLPSGKVLKISKTRVACNCKKELKDTNITNQIRTINSSDYIYYYCLIYESKAYSIIQYWMPNPARSTYNFGAISSDSLRLITDIELKELIINCELDSIGKKSLLQKIETAKASDLICRGIF